MNTKKHYTPPIVYQWHLKTHVEILRTSPPEDEEEIETEEEEDVITE